MKKILLIVPLSTLNWGSKNAGGVDSVCQMLLQQLEQNPSESFLYRVIAFNPHNSCANEGKVLKLNNSLEIVQFNVSNKNKSKLNKLPNLFYQLNIIRNQVKQFEPELTHSHLACWLIGVPNEISKLATLHSYKKIAREPRSFINNLLYEKITPYLSSLYIDRYTSVSKFLGNAVMEDIAKPISIVYNPIDNKYFNNEYIQGYSKEIKLVTCALLTKRKGIHHLIAVVEKLKESGELVSLDIIGPASDGNYVSDLKDLINEKELNENIRFLGAKKTDEIIKVYDNCDIGICLSEEETFGLVPIEMLAAKLPVICSKTGVIEDFVNDGIDVDGLNVVINTDYDGIENLAKNIKNKTIDINATFINKYFSTRKIINNYEEQYKKLLNHA